MKKIGLVFVIFIVALTVTKTVKAGDSWVAKKDTPAWEEKGYVYAVGQASYGKTMSEQAAIEAFAGAAKNAADKIKTELNAKKLQDVQIGAFEYQESSVVVLVAVPVALNPKTLYPQCADELEDWPNKKIKGIIFSCMMDDTVYVYTTAGAAIEKNDTEAAKKAANADARKGLASHLNITENNLEENFGFKIQDSAVLSGNEIKVLCRCRSPKQPGTTTTAYTFSSSSTTSSSKDTNSNLNTDKVITPTKSEKVETKNITSEESIMLACDELQVTSYDKIPDNWYLLYPKVKHFRVGNTLYIIGHGQKKKTDLTWNGAITGAKTDAQTELVRITSKVVTSIVCDQNDSNCLLKTDVSGIAKNLGEKDKHKDEKTKEDYYSLMFVPFSDIVTKY